MSSKSLTRRVDDSKAAAAVRGPSRRRLLAFLLLGVGLVVGLAAKPGYDWWHTRRTDQYRTACAAATEAKAWERLEAVAARWVDWDPRNDDGWVYLAEAHVQQSRPREAADALGRVSDSYHGALQALAVRAEILFADLNQPYAAEETWQRMLRINRFATLPRQRLIYFYAMTLQRRKLVEGIDEAIRLGCEPPEAYAYLLISTQLNFSDGLATVTRWRANYGDDETLEVAQAVYAAKKTANRGMATFGTSTVMPGDQSLIDACLRKYPSNLEVLALHIDKAIFEGDSARVAELLARSPEPAERDARFWRYRGWLLGTQGRHADAEEALRRGLELHPVDWETRWMLADALRHLGRIEEADGAARLALQGKELQTKLFERADVRDLDAELASDFYAYLKQTGPPFVAAALGRRV